MAKSVKSQPLVFLPPGLPGRSERPSDADHRSRPDQRDRHFDTDGRVDRLPPGTGDNAELRDQGKRRSPAGRHRSQLGFPG